MTTRRDAIILLAATALPAPLTAAQQPKFFTPNEYRALDRLTEMILPATDRSGGASAAKVADFIDLVIANSPPEVQSRWRAGIAGFGPDLAAALDRAAAEESAPATPAGRFFIELKRATIHAYYTSEIGLSQELGSLGPQVLAAFPDCTSGVSQPAAPAAGDHHL
jgi:hypothetical protein